MVMLFFEGEGGWDTIELVFDLYTQIHIFIVYIAYAMV